MSIWASIVTFDDYNDDATGAPPLIYVSNGRPPTVHDVRGGQFDVAAVPGQVDPVDGELPGLRFAVTTAAGRHAVVVLDGFQCAQLAGKIQDWLAMNLDGTP